MTDDRTAFEIALRRQMDLCKGTWLDIIESRVLANDHRRLSALDVGCGPGFGIELFKSKLDVVGIDRSLGMAKWARERGHDVILGRGQDLPFADSSFDVVYCSFVLTWVSDPLKFLNEMLRVSRRWVMCLAEPDSLSRIDLPREMRQYTDCVNESIVEAGGNPTMGRDLCSMFRQLGYEPMVGANAGGAYAHDILPDWLLSEWNWVEQVLSSKPRDPPLTVVKSTLDKSLESDELFHFTPLFYAVVDKQNDSLKRQDPR